MVQFTPLIVALGAAAYASAAYPVNEHFARQLSTGDLPSQCQSPCGVINSITSCGTSLSCICSSSNMNNFQTCLNCLASADPTVAEEASSAIDTFNQGCAGQGAGSLTAPAGGSSPTSTALSSGSSSGSSSSGDSSGSSGSGSGSSSNPLGGKTGGASGLVATSGLAVVAAVAGVALAL